MGGMGALNAMAGGGSATTGSSSAPMRKGLGVRVTGCAVIGIVVPGVCVYGVRMLASLGMANLTHACRA